MPVREGELPPTPAPSPVAWWGRSGGDEEAGRDYGRRSRGDRGGWGRERWGEVGPTTDEGEIWRNMDAGEVNMKERIFMTRMEYSILKEKMKNGEYGWSNAFTWILFPYPLLAFRARCVLLSLASPGEERKEGKRHKNQKIKIGVV
jgi:hypothetical protein